jgi:beta-galactosidase
MKSLSGILFSIMTTSLLLVCTNSLIAQRTIIDLNGTWEFDRTERAFPPEKFNHTIPVPGLIHLAEPMIDDYDTWFKKPLMAEAKEAHGVYDIDYLPRYNWYRKSIMIDKELDGREFLLRIKKSQYVTQVIVNGIDMGTSMECYTPIEVPVTRALKVGQENEILIRVGDRYWLPPQAAGSTDKEKEHYLPGIWDDVEMIASGKVQVNNTLMLPDAAGGKVLAKVRLRSFYPQQIMYGDSKFDSVSLKVEVFEKLNGRKAGENGVQVKARREHFTMVEIPVNIADPILWSPDHPFLYAVKTTVMASGEVIDSQMDHFGLRDFERRGKYFYLNGEKMLLRGTNITLQRFFEDPDCADLAWDREWVKRLLIDDPKAIHWNAMRICVGIVPDFWYDLADEYGMMFQNEWNYWQTHGWDEQIRTEYTNWIWSDGNHPSIVIWDAINENWDEYIGNTLIPELQKLDPTRTWDAGYMTASQMGVDEMDEPHPYEGRLPWKSEEELNEMSYALGDLDYRNEQNIASIESSAAQLVNEYGWVWLWRNGQASKLTTKIYEYYTGKSATAEENRAFQAYWLQCETEWLRSIRTHAGVLAFTHLTNNYGYTGDWYINDIADLEKSPTLEWFRHAFAPSAVFINHPDERYMYQFEPHDPDSRLLFTLKAINDFNATESGRVTISLRDQKGNIVWKQEQEVKVSPYGEKNYPVVLDLPSEAGGYTLMTEFEGKLSPMKRQISRRYINVGYRSNHYFEVTP